MESKKVIKFFSYTKKILAMSFFSLILSISLSNKSLFAIDKINLTVSNGTTYVKNSDKNDDESKVLYELSNDKSTNEKSLSAVVGDVGAIVYSKASYKDNDGKEADAPVTSISISANSGVDGFTVKLVDPKNDRIKINSSEDDDLKVKLEYDENLGQSDIKRIFDGTDMTLTNYLGKIALTVKPLVSSDESSELYDYGYGSDEGSVDKSDNDLGSSDGSSGPYDYGYGSGEGSVDKSDVDTTKKEPSSDTKKINGTSDTSSSINSSSSSKSSSSATKSASTKTSDASLIPLSILACSGASVLFFKKKD